MPTAAKKRSTSAVSHLAHLIPAQFFYEDYVSRKIEGVWDLDLLHYAQEANDNVLLFGPTGPGKTSLVMAYGAKHQVPVATVQCNGAVDPNTFWGGLSFDEDGNLKGWQDSTIKEVIEHGGLLYLDEVNFLLPKISAAFHDLLDKRRQITILELGNLVVKAHPNLVVVAAYNPDYEGTKPLNPAFKNRFKIKVKMDYDRAVEQELIGLPVMLDLAQKLREGHKNGDLETPTSTNMLIEFEELAVDLGYDFAVGNFLNAFSDEERKSVGEVFEMFSEEISRQVEEMIRLAAEAD